MSLDCGRKVEYLKKTHIDQESNLGPSCCEATVLTTTNVLPHKEIMQNMIE